MFPTNETYRKISKKDQILGPKAKKTWKSGLSSNLFFLGDARDEKSVGTPVFSDGHH